MRPQVTVYDSVDIKFMVSDQTPRPLPDFVRRSPVAHHEKRERQKEPPLVAKYRKEVQLFDFGSLVWSRFTKVNGNSCQTILSMRVPSRDQSPAKVDGLAEFFGFLFTIFFGSLNRNYDKSP